MVAARPGFVAVLGFFAWSAQRIDAQVGSVLEERKISNLEGGFPGQLRHDEYFGISVAPLGDLNGDGTGDLAVSSWGDGGTVWILFLERSGQVLAHNRITGTGPHYSHGLANVGDLDGDGLAELAVSINVRTRTTTTIAVDILFFWPDGAVRTSRRIEPTDPVFFPRIGGEYFDYFGYGLAGLGDADQDGVGDLVIGAPADPDGPGTFNGALWIVYLERDGSPKKAHKISERWGGGAGRLDTRDLGISIAPLGDLDGDGNLDLLVGEPGSFLVQPGSSILVLFLDENENLRDVRKTFQQECGLPQDGSFFGQALAVLGDLDSDRTIEFAVGAPNWSNGATLPQGALLVGSLRRDGSLARSVLISGERGGFARELEEFTGFGYSLAGLGDLDGDGGPDLAVGAYTDEDGADEAGAVWIVDLDVSAVRNGSGQNPLTLGQAAEPSVGHYWKVALDCSGHGPGLAYVAGFGAPHPGQPTPAGELLVDIFASPQLFRLVAPHAGTPASFLAPIPRDVSLIGRALYVQGLCSGAPGLQLSNALDVVIGR